MDASALIVTWNNAADISTSIDAALAQHDVDLEVVVVDNASTDGTQGVLSRYADNPRVTVVLQSENLGFAAGNNLAATHARGRYLLLLNPDCAPDPSCAAVLRDYLESHPECGAAAAMLRYPDGRGQSFLRREATFALVFFCFLEVGRRLDRIFCKGRHLARRIYAELDGVVPDPAVSVDCPAAACVMLPAALVAERFFDPELPLFFNDGELYRRLRGTGYDVVAVGAATAIHTYGTSVAEVPSARRRAEMVASLRAYLRPVWSGPLRAALWLLLLADALACLAFTRTRDVGRGTLGGLGLPGGAPPWLAHARSPRPWARRRRQSS